MGQNNARNLTAFAAAGAVPDKIACAKGARARRIIISDRAVIRIKCEFAWQVARKLRMRHDDCFKLRL